MFLSDLDIIGLRRSGAVRDYMGMCGLSFFCFHLDYKINYTIFVL